MMILYPQQEDKNGMGGASPLSDNIVLRAPRDTRVLIVEDEWFISMEIATTLEDAGYTVVGTAISADDAVRLAETSEPDLVLMDIHLRGKGSGIDAAIEINDRFGLRCIFVSAFVDADTRKRGQVASPAGWLSKPFSSQQLINAVQNGLKNL